MRLLILKNANNAMKWLMMVSNKKKMLEHVGGWDDLEALTLRNSMVIIATALILFLILI